VLGGREQFSAATRGHLVTNGGGSQGARLALSSTCACKARGASTDARAATPARAELAKDAISAAQQPATRQEAQDALPSHWEIERRLGGQAGRG
jgi:hypothetical protein